MGKFVPYEKLSKKQKRKIDMKSRKGWGNISPITRKAEEPKVYKRIRNWREEDDLNSGS